jgi:hypothetical protein
LPFPAARAMNACVAGCVLRRVTAMMWSTELRRRLPYRLSRWRTGCPPGSADEAGIGAVPV